MRATLNTKAALTIALILAGEFAGVGRSAAAGSPEPSSTITIRVHNYAKVDDNTMEEAEEVAAGIFRKVGVGIRWVDIDLTLECEPEKSLGNEVFTPSRIQLNIFPGGIAERLDVPGNAMGLAPGSGTDRHLVYVFYNRVEAVSQRQMRARQNREIALFASKSTILGYAIAHELGHVLLNLEIHSASGIMRGGWDKKDPNGQIPGLTRSSQTHSRSIPYASNPRPADRLLQNRVEHRRLRSDSLRHWRLSVQVNGRRGTAVTENVLRRANVRLLPGYEQTAERMP